MRDQLCTLLFTFADQSSPNKEITTAHTFSTNDPTQYPQHRRVIHSKSLRFLKDDKRDEGNAYPVEVCRISRSDFSAKAGRLGSDMIEHLERSSSLLRHGTTAKEFASPTAAFYDTGRESFNDDEEMLLIQDISLTYFRPPSEDVVSTPEGTTFLTTAIAQPIFLQYREKTSDGINGSGGSIQASPFDPTNPEHRAAHDIFRAELRRISPDDKIESLLPSALCIDIPLRVTSIEGPDQRQQASDQGDESIEKQDISVVGPAEMSSSSSSLPVRHRQTRSFESREETLVKETGQTKQKTVFERFTRELLTSKSTTTTSAYGPAPQPITTTVTAPGSFTPDEPVPKHFQQQQPKRGVGLPRHHDTYYDVPDRQRHQPQTELQHQIPSPPRPSPSTISDQQTHQKQQQAIPISIRQQQHSAKKPTREFYSTEHYEVEDYSLTRRQLPSSHVPRQQQPQHRGARVVAVPAMAKSQQQGPTVISPPPTHAVGSDESGIVKPRLIDFDTYKREVEYLQRKATLSPPGRPRSAGQVATEEPLVPLSPAIIVPKPPRIDEVAETERRREFQTIPTVQKVYEREIVEKLEVVETSPLAAYSHEIPIIDLHEKPGGLKPSTIVAEDKTFTKARIEPEIIKSYAFRKQQETEISVEKLSPKPELEAIKFEITTTIPKDDKKLLEMLRRELQYEEEVDYEVKKKRRGVKGDEQKAPDGLEGEKEMLTETKEVTLSLSSSTESDEQQPIESGEIEERTKTEQIIERQKPPLAPVTTKTTMFLPPIAEEESPSFKEKIVIEKKRVEPRHKSAEPYRYYRGAGIDSPQLPPMDFTSSGYRSAISARHDFNHRTFSPPPGHRLLKMVTETSSSGSLSPYPPSSTVASTLREARERDKKEMSELNDRLASYIEKVRFLEAQNRKLEADIEFLRNRWGRDTMNIREMYESDILQAKRLIDETNKQREDLLNKIRALEDEIVSTKQRCNDAYKSRVIEKDVIDDLLAKLAALESELNLLKRKVSHLEQNVVAIRKDNQHLMDQLLKARANLDQQTLNRIDFQNQAQTLLEEIDFIRRSHNQEIEDLQAIAARDTTSENREFFRNELAAAIKEIRYEYDQISQSQRTDIESWYKLKVQEIQTQSARQNMEQTYHKEELKRLRTQLSDLRGRLADLEGRNNLLERQAEELTYQLDDDHRANEAALTERDMNIRKVRDECQTLMVELQMLLDTKQSLDSEIAIYRKMLEGDEDRVGLRQLVEQVVRSQKRTADTETTRVVRGETSSRQSYQRSAKGNVSVKEASLDGRFVIIENTHRAREENISEWKLKRRIDGKMDITFTFPKNFVLKPGKSVTIWARGQGFYNPPEQLVSDEETFGSGHNIHTILYNRENEERASLIQRSSQMITGV